MFRRACPCSRRSWMHPRCLRRPQAWRSRRLSKRHSHAKTPCDGDGHHFRESKSTPDAQPQEASNPHSRLTRSRPLRDPATDCGARLRGVRTAKGGLEYSYSHEAKVKGPYCFIATVSLFRCGVPCKIQPRCAHGFNHGPLSTLTSFTLLEKRRVLDPGGYDGGGEGTQGGTATSALRSTGALSTRKRAMRGTSTRW